MSSFFYCKSCGGKTASVPTPKFCSQCGYAFFSAAAPKSVARAKQPEPEPESGEDSGTDVYEVPQIDSFKYSVDFGGESQGVTLAEINEGNIRNKKSRKSKKRTAAPQLPETTKTKEEIFAEFQKTAGNSTKPTSID